MAHPQTQPPYSWQTYLEWEAQLEGRWEFLDGEIVSLAGASNRHNEIVGNVQAALRPSAQGNGCKVFTETVKLYRHQSEQYLYPDLMITCHPLDKQSHYGVRSPVVIAEVLSPVNLDHHLVLKLREYTKLPSLRHYLLISQSECLVQHYHRNGQQQWQLALYDQMEAVIPLALLSEELPVGAIYAGIAFGSQPSEAQEPFPPYEKSAEGSTPEESPS